MNERIWTDRIRTLNRKASFLVAVTPLSFLIYERITHFASVRALDSEVLEQADYLYSCGETQKLHQLLVHHKDSDDAEFLWRLARASRDLALLSSVGADEKKRLTYEAFDYAKKALEKNEASFAAHKWFAICLSDVGDYEGIKVKIGNSYIIRNHLEALAFFLKAEEVDPNFYSKNLLMLGKTYTMLSDVKRATLWLTKARDYPAVTEEDKQVCKQSLITVSFIRFIVYGSVIFMFGPMQVHKEALELLKKLGG
ncbi:regulator of microtubule dynamics 1 [Labeo rohita]|uniref:Regulator of microtubule dynamics protein 1 n=1 Tax=Labeo rohita TaxID=84645 RepID=A0A498MCU4_LABRO|nr:regulator of microtubule dynamics 1 [Labeo rohita]